MKHISKKEVNRYSKYKRKDQSKKAAARKTPPKNFRQKYNRRFRARVNDAMLNVAAYEDFVLPVYRKIIKWEWW